MTRRVLILLAFLLSSPAGLAQTLAGRVVGVSDGDTITVLTAEKRRVKVRLHGIDCPESHQAFGAKAKQFASAIAFGKDASLRVTDTDRYGRTVAVVTIGGKVVNHELVRAGLAWWYRQYAPGDRTLERLENEARRAKRGLWADKSPTPPWEFRRGGSRSSGTSPPASSGTGSVSPLPRPPVEQGVTVYITRTGAKYHRAGCRYLSRSMIPIRLQDAMRNYSPCSVCRP